VDRCIQYKEHMKMGSYFLIASYGVGNHSMLISVLSIVRPSIFSVFSLS
jgi:hypothetical protein